ncbi:MAG TPA: head GIN domain-containing protein [Gillisia sp.]|nr:head GIN domain-containing protein [Gillisia sp.]
MKHVVIIIMVFLGFQINAQEITMDLDNFSEVEITRGLKVNFTKAEENKAVITGNSRDKVQVRVEKGVLTIKTSLNQLVKVDNTVVEIFYKQIHSIVARQNSSIEFCGKISQPILKVRASEGAEVMATIDVENLIAGASTGGTLNLMGNALIQEIDIKAAGEFKGENLKGDNINVNLNGGGNANIHATKYVNATARAGGNIYIYGNPEKVEEKASFGASIKKIN